MNLVVDVGNTSIKLAVFDNGRMVIDQITDAASFLRKIKELFGIYPRINNAIVSSVGKLTHKEIKVLSLFCKVHRLGPDSKIPFKNRYASPKTLGVDRIALATTAYYQYPKTNVLVIDAGTCITYDFLNDHGEYLGGGISPGVKMRYRAMHGQTTKLPLLDPEVVEDFIGNDTNGSMHSGVFFGVVGEVDGIIDLYNDRFPHLTVILTGGEAHFFGKRLKNSIFADSKFLLKGLNYLLEYNKQ